MKRYVKNIICVVILVLSIGLMVGYRINQNNTNKPNEINDNMSGNMPEKQNESNEKRDGLNEKTEMPSEARERPNDERPEMSGEQTSNNTVKDYLIYGSLSLITSLVLIYLIMSKFNKNKVFINQDKIIIYILSVLILSVILTYISNIKINKTNQINKPNNSSLEYTANLEIKENKTIESGTYESASADENAILVSGEIDVNISNVTINKTGNSDSGDNTSFYGTNSAIIAKDKANLVLKNMTINTNANGSNGVFSYGGSASTNNTSSDGTTITISDSTITTTKDNSGGIMTTGGGTMNANNLTITTSGISSAAIRSDRGGGNVNVDGGTYTTNGKGSPSIYSTANIIVKNAKLVSNASEGIVIEGKNSVSIENVELVDTNNELNGKSTTYKNIFLYQSMSGDAATGKSSFTSTNSKITTNKGDTFYVTNTDAIITLKNNTIINNGETGNFLRIQADSWGNTGSNGGNVALNLNDENISGNIIVDSISSLEMNLESTTYEGTLNGNDINITVDKNSSIKLTGDSYIKSINDYSNIDFNGYKLYVNGNSIN
mgnify:CR=1 FL=1